jgi:hypothetical protein
MNKKPDWEPKRRNRAVAAGEAVAPAIDAALRKRGFASRDLVANWAVIAPVPYGTAAMPERMVWPRGGRGAEGATLYLRCAPGHALALSHEAAMIGAAINRYFGYLLVDSVRISAAPLVVTLPAPASERRLAAEPEPPAVKEAVAGVPDDGLRTALGRLGKGIYGKDKGR